MLDLNAVFIGTKECRVVDNVHFILCDGLIKACPFELLYSYFHVEEVQAAAKLCGLPVDGWQECTDGLSFSLKI